MWNDRRNRLPRTGRPGGLSCTIWAHCSGLNYSFLMEHSLPPDNQNGPDTSERRGHGEKVRAQFGTVKQYSNVIFREKHLLYLLTCMYNNIVYCPLYVHVRVQCTVLRPKDKLVTDDLGREKVWKQRRSSEGEGEEEQKEKGRRNRRRREKNERSRRKSSSRSRRGSMRAERRSRDKSREEETRA